MIHTPLAPAAVCQHCDEPIAPERMHPHVSTKYCSARCGQAHWKLGKRQKPERTLEDWRTLEEAFVRERARKVWEAVCFMCGRAGPEQRLTDEQVRVRRLLGEPRCTNCRGVVYLEPSVGPRR